ncbi:MAG: hypothetical protein KF779_07520 [Hyphomonadaceae bacterium]|nr:hypothetical protein [Hyphomonadaceae bacterium]
MNAEHFITTADSLRSRALHSGVDVNASNFLVHAALLRALRTRPFDELTPETLAQEIESAHKKLS